jgi:hypothetical protein
MICRMFDGDSDGDGDGDALKELSREGIAPYIHKCANIPQDHTSVVELFNPARSPSGHPSDPDNQQIKLPYY